MFAPFICTGWRTKCCMDKIRYQPSNDKWNGINFHGTINPHLCVAPKVKGHMQICGIFGDCPHVDGQQGWGTIGTLTKLPRNARRDFCQAHVRRWGVVSLWKSRNGRGSDKIFFVFTQSAKTDFRIRIGTPIDHLSVKFIVLLWFLTSCYAIVVDNLVMNPYP